MIAVGYYEIIIISGVAVKTDTQTKGTEIGIQKQTHTYMTDFFLAKAPRKFSVESMIFNKWCQKKWVAISKKNKNKNKLNRYWTLYKESAQDRLQT